MQYVSITRMALSRNTVGSKSLTADSAAEAVANEDKTSAVSAMDDSEQALCALDFIFIWGLFCQLNLVSSANPCHAQIRRGTIGRFLAR